MSDLKFQPDIPAPYLIYLGDVTDEACCKTGFGMAHWASERTIGQFRSNEDTVSVGLADMTLEEAVAAGAKSLIIGIADVGGCLSESWHGDLIKAANAGLNIVSGGHQKLAEIPGLSGAAAKAGVKLVEMADTRRDSLCCGGGGGRIWMDTPKGERFSDIRIGQASDAKAEVLVTSCPYCIDNFEDSKLSMEESEALEIKDITEIIQEVI